MAYSSFKDTVAAIEKRGMSADSAAAIAATAGRAKYGKKAFQHAAATGTSLRNVPPLKGKRKKHPQHNAIMKFVRSNNG